MRKRVDGSFEKREVDRTVPDLIRFIVYLGAGRHLHGCSIEKLYEYMSQKQRYKSLDYDEFKKLLKQCDKETHHVWAINIFDDIIIVN